MMDDKELSTMSPARQIEYAVQFFANTLGLKVPVFATGTVKSVDEAERTCSVEISMGDVPEIMEGVNLMATNADGFLRIPAIDSEVQIRVMPDNEAYVHMWSDLDAVVCWIDNQNEFRFDKDGFVWNGGVFNGLVKIDAQTLKLNQLVAELQAQLVLISASISGLGGSYVPGTISPFNKTDYEDTKIKH